MQVAGFSEGTKMCRGLAVNLIRNEKNEIEAKCSFADGSHVENTIKTINKTGNDDKTLPLEVMVEYGKLIWDIDKQRKDEKCVELLKKHYWLKNCKETVSKENLYPQVLEFIEKWMKTEHFRICEAIALFGETRSAGKFKENLYAYHSEIGNDLNASSSKIGNNLYAAYSEIGNNLNAYSSEIGKDMDVSYSKIGNDLYARFSEIGRDLNAPCSKIGRDLNAYRSEIGGKLIISEDMIEKIEVRSKDDYEKVIGKVKLEKEGKVR